MATHPPSSGSAAPWLDGHDASRPSLNFSRVTRRSPTSSKTSNPTWSSSVSSPNGSAHRSRSWLTRSRICPTVSRRQAETLETIAGELQTTNDRTQELAATINEIPRVARTQSETLAGIGRQLEMSGEQNVLANQTMGKLEFAIGRLGEANQSQAEALRSMHDSTSERNNQLAELIANQSKRFTMLFIVTVLLAAAAVAIIGIVIRAQ